MATLQFNDQRNGTTLELLESASESFDVKRSLAVKKEKVNPFKEIGIGKPMTIKLITIYAGDYDNKLFKNKRDLIVTSQIKSPIDPDIPSRAVHQIYPAIHEKVAVSPSAGNYGTPLIYCTPSFVDEGMMIKLELKLDDFNEGDLKTISTSMKSLGGLPILASVSGYFMLAGALTNLVAPIINTLAERKAWLAYDFDIPIKEAGRKPFKGDFYIVRNESDKDEFANYVVDKESNPIQLKRRGTNAEYYQGSRPYAIISINGDMEPEYEGFTPALASAAVLQKFFGVRETGTLGEDVKELLKISNDFLYNQKIQKLYKKIEGTSADSEEYKTLNDKIQAYQKNFQTDLFKNTSQH